jgi:hypothetical protein
VLSNECLGKKEERQGTKAPSQGEKGTEKTRKPGVRHDGHTIEKAGFRRTRLFVAWGKLFFQQPDRTLLVISSPRFAPALFGNFAQRDAQRVSHPFAVS